MTSRTPVEKFFFCVSVIGFGLSLAGTRSCQESYNVASQLQSTPVATDDPNASETTTPTVSPTSTHKATRTPTPIVTVTAIVTTSISGTPTVVPTVANPLLSTLRTVGTRTAQEATANAAKNLNWLGKEFSSSSDGAATIDSDGDGFADWFELKLNSDPNNAASTPNFTPRSKLVDRVGATALEEYRAMIEVARSKEKALGLCQNGSAWVLPNGSNPGFVDSDCDGIPDDIEQELGTDPNNGDSDNDGVMDGAEVQLGSDPTVADY